MIALECGSSSGNRSLIERTLDAQQGVCSSRHEAAICYIMRPEIIGELSNRFCPEDVAGVPAKSGLRREIKHRPLVLSVPPQPAFVLLTQQSKAVIGVVDLLIHLPYSAEAQTFRDVTPVASPEYSREVVPLLVLVRLGAASAASAILEFNVLRQYIQRYAVEEPNLYDLFDNRCLLVTDRCLSEPEADMLAAADVEHLVLEDAFDAFYQHHFACREESLNAGL